jgi:hypothetical protein
LIGAGAFQVLVGPTPDGDVAITFFGIRGVGFGTKADEAKVRLVNDKSVYRGERAVALVRQLFGL